jgi:hypothetical protein
MLKTLRTGPLLAAGLVVGCLHLLACGQTEPAPDASYTTQGRVVMVKDPKSPASTLKIHHEAIPNFVDGQGQVVGMHSHPMDFPRAAEGIDIDALEVGQAVRFTFDVYWQPETRWVITDLERLPDDTRFAFETPTDEQPTSTPDSSGG